MIHAQDPSVHTFRPGTRYRPSLSFPVYETGSSLTDASFIIVAFERGRSRKLSQSLALAAVSVFVTLLIVDLIFELFLGRGSVDGICRNHQGLCKSSEFESRVDTGTLAS
jgi:hypothetical protein